MPESAPGAAFWCIKGPYAPLGEGVWGRGGAVSAKARKRFNRAWASQSTAKTLDFVHRHSVFKQSDPLGAQSGPKGAQSNPLPPPGLKKDAFWAQNAAKTTPNGSPNAPRELQNGAQIPDGH